MIDGSDRAMSARHRRRPKRRGARNIPVQRYAAFPCRACAARCRRRRRSTRDRKPVFLADFVTGLPTGATPGHRTRRSLFFGRPAATGRDRPRLSEENAPTPDPRGGHLAYRRGQHAQVRQPLDAADARPHDDRIAHRLSTVRNADLLCRAGAGGRVRRDRRSRGAVAATGLCQADPPQLGGAPPAEPVRAVGN